ncbi:MAG: TM2 domain-containing protein [Saprospiraceae bacterium]|nr:TM2 domain-containing protein [Saprospiraceae bacterium]
MKHLIMLTFLGMFLTPMFANTAANYSSAQLALKVKESGLPAQISQMSVEQFIALTPTQVKNMTGERMRFKDIVALKSIQKAVKKEIAQEGNAAGGKSQLVALLLVIFVGVFGIHRFYLGYPLIGFLQLITLGFCGIGTLIDFFRIIFGDLKPSRGREYDPAF